MKKILMRFVIGIVTVLLLSGVSGCSPAPAPDGTYTAEYQEPDTYGWTAFLTVVLTEGKITSVEFNEKNAEGVLKSEDTAYQSAWQAVNAAISSEQVYSKLETQFKTWQNTDGVDTVTGATASSRAFRELADALLKQIENSAGEETPPGTILVPRSESAGESEAVQENSVDDQSAVSQTDADTGTTSIAQ